jgi:hypothetical protein
MLSISFMGAVTPPAVSFIHAPSHDPDTLSEQEIRRVEVNMAVQRFNVFIDI